MGRNEKRKTKKKTGLSINISHLSLFEAPVGILGMQNADARLARCRLTPWMVNLQNPSFGPRIFFFFLGNSL